MEFSQNAFAAPTRTLTGLGSGALTIGQTANGVIAAASSVTFTQAAGTVQTLDAAAVADATGTVNISFTDGINTWTPVTVAAGTTGGQVSMISSNTVSWLLHNNSATVAAHYFAAGQALSQ